MAAPTLHTRAGFTQLRQRIAANLIIVPGNFQKAFRLVQGDGSWSRRQHSGFSVTEARPRLLNPTVPVDAFRRDAHRQTRCQRVHILLRQLGKSENTDSIQRLLESRANAVDLCQRVWLLAVSPGLRRARAGWRGELAQHKSEEHPKQEHNQATDHNRPHSRIMIVRLVFYHSLSVCPLEIARWRRASGRQPVASITLHLNTALLQSFLVGSAYARLPYL
jgi:hypothetical protein